MDNDLGRQSIVAWAGGAPESAAGASGDEAAAFTPAEQKFRVEMLIGRGGMGEVHLVTDEDLKRQIAMKVMREDAAEEREHRLSFVAEAQATSQLEHPGIPPVHDIGLTPDGRLYFTMKLVQGRTLAEVIHDLALKRREVQREYNLHKLVSNLEKICEAMHFAHERGVIHRDLKPENIMLGDYGEVHVMDWGLARVEAEFDEDVEDAAYVQTAKAGSGTETQHGQIKGTPPYMSPEQFRGDSSAVDERSDIYALGCLLYEMLTLHPAFGGNLSEIISKKMAGEVVDVRERNPRRNAPEPLADVCRKAMAAAASERYGTAREMGDALRVWLDGRGERARRHQEAETLAAKGKDALAEYTRLTKAVTDAERAADEEAAKVKPWQSVAEKDALLTARERVESLETDAALAFAETTRLLDAALTQETDNATARGALAALWKSRLEDAERRGDKADTAHALATLRLRESARDVETGRGTLVGEDTARRRPASDGLVPLRAEERGLRRHALSRIHRSRPAPEGGSAPAPGRGDWRGVRVRAGRADGLRRGQGDEDHRGRGLRHPAPARYVRGLRGVPGRGGGRGGHRGRR